IHILSLHDALPIFVAFCGRSKEILIHGAFMNFLTEEQTLWHETVARVMEKEVTREYVRQCDIDRQYPYEAYEKIARMGWLRLLIPEEQGGDGGTIFDYALMCEGLARYGFDFATAFMVSTFTAMNIVKFGTPEDRKSTRLNSSHVKISYAVFCLKKKKYT